MRLLEKVQHCVVALESPNNDAFVFEALDRVKPIKSHPGEVAVRLRDGHALGHDGGLVLEKLSAMLEPALDKEKHPFTLYLSEEGIQYCLAAGFQEGGVFKVKWPQDIPLPHL